MKKKIKDLTEEEYLHICTIYDEGADCPLQTGTGYCKYKELDKYGDEEIEVDSNEAKDKYNFSDFDLECLIPIDDFIDDIECHGIMDCDGQGEFIFKKKRRPVRKFTTEECEKMKKKGCEFVCWYNK